MFLIWSGIASFCPKKKGTYEVQISQDGGKFPGSPFKLEIGDGQVATPAKVKLSGAVRDGEANKVNEIVCDCTNAGTLCHDFVYIWHQG